MGLVYVLQVGNSDCYKVGFTKKTVTKRATSISTGSPEKLTEVLYIETEHYSLMEKLIHEKLDHKRAPNGEFFNCDIALINDAIQYAQQYIDRYQTYLNAVENYKTIPPDPQLVVPTPEIIDIHSELREAKRQQDLITRKVDALEAVIKCTIGTNLGIAGIAEWKWFTQSRIDSTLLKERYPSIAQEVTKESGFRKFSLERNYLK